MDRADHDRDPRRALPRAAARPGGQRRPVRPDHGGVVPRHRGARRPADRDASGGAHRARPAHGHRVRRRAARRRVHRARRRHPVHRRRRGALRGHGPLRPAAHRDRLVRARAAEPHPQLLRPGRVHALRRQGGAHGVLRARPARAAHPDDRALGHRDRHRLAGAHLGRVLAHAASGAARPLAARHGRAHERGARRPDLRARGELGADDRVRIRARRGLPVVRQVSRPRPTGSPSRGR